MRRFQEVTTAGLAHLADYSFQDTPAGVGRHVGKSQIIGGVGCLLYRP